MRRLIVTVLFIFSINPVYAVSSPVNGVWRGKLGGMDIVACFNGEQSGNYYYIRHKQPIRLSREEKSNIWMEEGKTGSWKLDLPVAKKLRGDWQAPENGKPLAITLGSPSNEKDDQPCASSEYNQALEDFPKLKMGSVEDFNGRKYRRLRIADVETIELMSSGAADGKVNLKLRAVLPKSKADLEEYFLKRREFLGNFGYAAEDETFAQPYYWSDDWITVHYYRWAAGFGARGITLNYRTWNMKTGEEVDLWKWFGTQSYSYSDMAPLPDRLKKYLIKDADIEAECRHDYYGEGEYHVTLESTGMKFWENAFGDGCEKEFIIPYKDIGPFLTPEGKIAIRTFLKR
jgi:hypothetical protein